MLDVLIVHVPKFQNHYRSLGNYVSTQLMALGMFGLGDYLVKQKFSVKILHLGIERALDEQFNLAKYIHTKQPRLVAFTVQFHQQLYDTLRVVKGVKRLFPQLSIALGGLSATFFAEEILTDYQDVDFIICGEGEIPLSRLLSTLDGVENDYASVPNLYWRNGEKLVRNEENYVGTEVELDSIDFANLPLMEHYESYVKMPKIFTRMKIPNKVRWKLSKLLSQKSRPTFYALPVGRGCNTNCTYCGGGHKAHRLLSGRTRVSFRSPQKVVETICRLKDFGYQGAYLSFDPIPHSDNYYAELFDCWGTKAQDFDLIFAAWGLPSERFISGVSRTFSKHSSVNISPESGSERLRKTMRGISYSNQQLLETLATCHKYGVNSTVYFSLGIPGETADEFRETLALKKKIEKNGSSPKTVGKNG